ncbi:remorin-like [Sesamum indicum]|uniref:Remorin-like n=1 Tax=Sesamum indicum TaxID=4182 RepID=A0A8M8UVM9_SESIN|nr:remorin-like [Sesamum indicum]
MLQRSYDVDDDDDVRFATAVAASAHAIHSLDEAGLHVQVTKRNTTRKQEPLRPPQSGSVKKPSPKDGRNSSSLRPTLPVAADQKQKETPIRSSYSEADAWEKAQIAKIRKRYEKMQSEILAWENEKKLRAKQKMERKKGELELRKSRNLQHYYSKIARIDDIAGGARAQVDEKRRQEESVVKQKASRMRLTGRVPVDCFCF